MHKFARTRAKEISIITEVNAVTHEQLMEHGKFKIGWKIRKVQDYLGILRCLKCYGYYHFAKDCIKKEIYGNCTIQHATKNYKSEIKKSINCEDKIKNFKIKNIK